MLKNIHSHRLTVYRETELLSCSYRDVSALNLQQAVFLSVGIHPWYLTEGDYALQQEWVLQMVQDSRVIAIGEGGLDKLCTTPLDLQERAFRWLIELSESRELPLIIHCVKCAAELIRLKKECKHTNPWIVNGFRGKPQQAQEYLRHGVYLSYGEHFSVEAVRQTPLDSLFIETDESGIAIDELYQRIAEVKEIPLKSLEDSVLENINHVFY